MANSKSSSTMYEFATVDTDPGASGYFTNKISAREKNATRLYFSVRGSGTMTVTLQFKPPGDSSWTDYDSYAANTRVTLDEGGAVLWRAGVLNGDYTSGEKTFGLDW